MRFSKMLIPTLKETPAEAEVASHRLMLRAGMIRKLAAGIYSMLPLGLMVMRKVESIIREELNKAGAQELVMPAIQPSELWVESGRWHEYGRELLRIKDRHNREFCFGPTHEEVITDIIRKEIRSYRQLPLNLYQIQTKFRDEIRPRFGIMRGREFVMKDAYSFDCDEAGTKKTYRKMYEAYCAIFERCGLGARAVEADTGHIGGSFSHEFVVLADSGEDEFACCDRCEYAANIEKAECGIEEESALFKKTGMKELNPVETPNAKSIEQVSNFLKVEPSHLVKTLLFKANKEYIAVLVRGDYDINQARLEKALGCCELAMADDDTIQKITGCISGFSGPIGLKGARIVADMSVKYLKNFVVGANIKDRHYINTNVGRDFMCDEYYNIRKVVDEDKCPRCSGRLKIHRGIEVGHIFILGEKYSRKLRATYLDMSGKERFLNMGCYGIGVGRTAAAAIEQNNDENGIVWPVPIAPFKVIILAVNTVDEEVIAISEKIYESFLKRGIEVIIDDRHERPGIKFKDADLIGIPIQVIVGKKNLKEKKIEIKIRKTGERILENIDNIEGRLSEMLSKIV